MFLSIQPKNIKLKFLARLAVLPVPLLLTIIFVRSPLVLYFLSGISNLLIFLYLIVIGFNICRCFLLKKNRSVLTTFVSNIVIGSILISSAGVILYSKYSYEMVNFEISKYAEKILVQCQINGECPQSISGWKPRGNKDRFLLQQKIGWRVKYPVLYRPTEKGFQFYVYIGPDIGKEINYLY